MDKRARRDEACLVLNIYIPSTQSTNILLKEKLKTETLPEFFAVRTAFQTAGKGQVGNSWEAQRGKNLLFSVLLFPHHIAIHEQFIISQMVSVAIVRILKQYGIESSIKWPNDIYVDDKKLGGILIENSLRGSQIEYSIIGIGLNINQLEFKSDAPNPVSTFNILHKKIALKSLFLEIVAQLKLLYSETDTAKIKSEYLQFLYRKNGFFTFKIPNSEQFEAEIHAFGNDGQLWLKKRNGELVGFYFKEVEFVLY
jgi:BirA family transcriptional regulator, biotin operon repressor / biotin---[acetyl-CoA-carboxylase] ligase